MSSRRSASKGAARAATEKYPKRRSLKLLSIAKEENGASNVRGSIFSIENTELKENLAEQEEKNKNLQNQIARLQSAHKVKVSTLQERTDELQKDLEKQQEEKEDFEKQIKVLTSVNKECQDQIFTLQREAKRTRADLVAAADERNRLEDSLQETNELYLASENRLSDSRASERELKRQAVDLEKARVKAETNLAAAADLIAAEKEKGRVFFQKSQELQQGGVTLEASKGLQQHVSDSTSQLSELMKQLSEVTNEKTNAEADLALACEQTETQNVKILRLEATLATLEAERKAKFTEDRDTTDASHAKLEADKAAAVERAGRLEQTVFALQAQVGELEMELKVTLRSEMEGLTTELEAARQGLAEAEAKNETDARVNSHLHTELRNAKESRAQLEEAIHHMQVAKEHLEEDVKDHELQEVAHKDQITDLENQRKYILIFLLLFGLVAVIIGLVASGIFSV